MVNQQFATAVHVLTALACNKKELMNSDTLTTSVNTNPVVIRRLLSQLTKIKPLTKSVPSVVPCIQIMTNVAYGTQNAMQKHLETQNLSDLSKKVTKSNV